MSQIIELNKSMPEVTQFYGDITAFAPAELSDETKRGYRTVAASDKPTSDYRRILEVGLPIVASDLAKGQPMLVNHSTWRSDALPIGKTLTGTYNKKLKQVMSDFYLDDEDYNRRIIAGIDHGTISDVSIGAEGKFTCSFDESRMGWFGCFKSGHRRGDEIMVDASGNETDVPSEMVKTEIIYADFTVRLVDELSVVWSGAVDDAEITKKYAADPAQNKEIIDGMRKIYDAKLMDEYDLQRLTASYGGIPLILQQSTAPTSVPVTKPVKARSKNMSTELTPEVQAIVDEKDARITELETELEASQGQVTELEENTISESDITAKDEEIAELKASVSNLEAYEVKSTQYDAVVGTLRTKLKTAKRLKGVTGDELENWGTQVDEMQDASSMLVLLDEIRGDGTKNKKNYSRVIPVKKDEPEPISNVATETDQNRIRAAY